MIHVNDLSFHYKGEKPILKDLNTTLEPGHIYGLLGLNGEGKTTLLKLISGLIFPKKGEIKLNLLDSKSRSLQFFEQLYLLPDHPKKNNLKIKSFEKNYAVFYKNFSSDFFQQALRDFRIDHNDAVKNLSFGQQKKFHLAFALATNTKFLLLDEPTNGLDIPSKSIVRQLLAKSITDEKTFIISTHLVKDVENLIDHLLILRKGKLVFNQHIKDILNTYTFSQTNSPVSEAIHYEKSINTHHNILTNMDNQESNLDIELLFNAVIKNKI